MLINISSAVGGCECHITCTPCSGVDIPSSDAMEPGSISNNNQVDGKPLFTPHQSQAASDFWNDYKQQLKSYGVTSLYGGQLYRKKLEGFDPPDDDSDNSGNPKPKPKPNPTPTPKKVDDDITNKTVPIMGGSPLTFEEEQRLRLIKRFGPGYIDQANMFTSVENGAIEKKETHPYIELGRQVAIVGAGFLKEESVAPVIVIVDVISETMVKPGVILYNNAYNGTNDPVPGTGEMLVNAGQKITEDLVGNAIGGAAEHDVKMLTTGAVQQEMIKNGVLPGIAKISEKPGNIGEAVSNGYKYFNSGKDVYDGWGEFRKTTNPNNQ